MFRSGSYCRPYRPDRCVTKAACAYVAALSFAEHVADARKEKTALLRVTKKNLVLDLNFPVA